MEELAKKEHPSNGKNDCRSGLGWARGKGRERMGCSFLVDGEKPKGRQRQELVSTVVDSEEA